MGESLPSQVMQARAEIWSELPGPPAIKNDPLVTDNLKIGVEWAAPQYDGNSAILSYRLQVLNPGA